MMLKIEIALDGVAMLVPDEHGVPMDGIVSGPALREVLEGIPGRVAAGGTGGALMDDNGNTVGRWEIEG